jgi:hypothetical protein
LDKNQKSEGSGCISRYRWEILRHGISGKMLVGPFGGLEGWVRPKVVRLEYLLDAEDEQVVRHLRTKGHELHWVLETRLRQLQRDGWKPVTQWDKIGRRSIFMDRREEIILLHRRTPKTNEE